MDNLAYFKKQVSLCLQDKGVPDLRADELVKNYKKDVLYNFRIDDDCAQETAEYIFETEQEHLNMI